MKILYDTAMSFVHTPYLWGGDDPSGFDCSGLAIEILKSVGVLGRTYDSTAHNLFLKFREFDGEASLGALAFYGKEHKITHVGFCLDATRMIEAGGGGRHILTYQDAVKFNAFVRVRPIASRHDLVAIKIPLYKLIPR